MNKKEIMHTVLQAIALMDAANKEKLHIMILEELNKRKGIKFKNER